MTWVELSLQRDSHLFDDVGNEEVEIYQFEGKVVLSRADILLLADVYGRRMHNGINGFCKRDLAARLLFVRYRLFV